MKMDKEYKLTVEFRNGQRYCYYGKTKKQAIAEFKRNFGSFRGFIKKELAYGLLYGVSWIVFAIVMAAREREREERRFEEECRRERIAYERERRRRQAYNRNNIVRVRIM